MENTDVDFSTYDTFVKTAGVEKTENSLIWYRTHCKESEKWFSRKELLEILGVGKDALNSAIEQLKFNSRLEAPIKGQEGFNTNLEVAIKKGGYRNLETFYREDLVKLIQLQLIKNQTHQGHSNETITEVVDSAVKEKLTTSKAEDIRLAELNLATEQTRLAAEKEISKQMRMLLKNENLKKDLDKFRTDAIKIIHYGNTETSKLYIGVDVASPSNYKIGVASNIHRRESIGTTDNPNLKYIYMKDVGSKDAAESLEKTIHEELKEYNLKNFRPNIKPTEWFILTPEKLAFIVRKYDFLPYDLVKNGINS